MVLGSLRAVQKIGLESHTCNGKCLKSLLSEFVGLIALRNRRSMSNAKRTRKGVSVEKVDHVECVAMWANKRPRCIVKK